MKSIWLTSALIAAHALSAECHYLPSARPCVDCRCPPSSWGALFRLTALAWQAREDGLEFAVKNNPIGPLTANILANVNGRPVGVDFKWRPGFKLDAIVEFPTRPWDFDARWTYFYGHSSHTAHATPLDTGAGLVPLWLFADAFADVIYGRAEANWHLHFNTLDLEFGFEPFLTDRISLRFAGGLKGADIRQLYTVEYADGLSDGTPSGSSSSATKNRCISLGPRLGFYSKWRLKSGWSLLADTAGSLLLGHFEMHRIDADEIPDANYQSAFHEAVYAYRPALEFLLGVAWDYCYGCRKQYPLSLNAAYEWQTFWEQNMMPWLAHNAIIAFPVLSARSDLHLHGVSASITLGF